MKQEYPAIYSVKYLFCCDIFLADILTELNKYQNSLSVLYHEILSIKCNLFMKFTNFWANEGLNIGEVSDWHEALKSIYFC